SRVSQSLRRQGVQVRSRILTNSHPATAILEEASRSKSELVVLAPRHRDWKGIILLPSVTNALVHRECPPVLLCQARAAPRAVAVLNSLQRLNGVLAIGGTTV
ncbi:MAG TPA: universal stress protein, partial [Gemmatimonadales bacterium]|nr:universal stress protein [Gemmatimonadales bacterium]